MMNGYRYRKLHRTLISCIRGTECVGSKIGYMFEYNQANNCMLELWRELGIMMTIVEGQGETIESERQWKSNDGFGKRSWIGAKGIRQKIFNYMNKH